MTTPYAVKAAREYVTALWAISAKGKRGIGHRERRRNLNETLEQVVTGDSATCVLNIFGTNGILVNDGIRLVIGYQSGNGISVVSMDKAIEHRTTLVKIPKSAVLSVKSCSLAAVIPSAPYGHAAQLSLSLALYSEMLMGSDSRWYGYFQSFPEGTVDLPIFWDQETDDDGEGLPTKTVTTANMFLVGTECARLRDQSVTHARTLLEELNQFYYEIAKPILLKYSEAWGTSGEVTTSPLNLKGFHRAFSLVSSRAFLVDAYHGLAMVPIADAFNHVLENHVHLESDYNVCPECGSLYECSHDRDEHGFQPVEATVSDCDNNDGYYEMVSNTAIPPNTEIFNTYGEELTNAQLLNQYGFILDANDNDRLTWDLADILGTLTPSMSTLFYSPMELDDLAHRLLRVLPDVEHALSNSQLVYIETSAKHPFCLNSDGAMSSPLWATLFLLSARDRGLLSEAAQTLLSEVLTLQLDLESSGIGDNEDTDTDTDSSPCITNDSESFKSPISEVEESRDPAQHVLLSICRLAVQLCTYRKANSGPKGYTNEQLYNILDSDTHGDGREGERVKMAASLLIGERSILDACAASWTAVAHAFKGTVHT